MPDSSYSPVIENYLKHLYQLGRSGDISTNALARALGVSPASATSMLRRLTEKGLVAHTPYRGAQLTAEGEQVALHILRRHRLLELFLHHALKMPLDEVHEEAEQLEHAMSGRLESYISAWLGHPTHDPHGDPIPTPDGTLPPQAERCLTALDLGKTATVSRVPDDDSAQLKALLRLGLRPGVQVTLLGLDAALGTASVQVSAEGQGPQTLALAVAQRVMIKVTPVERTDP